MSLWGNQNSESRNKECKVLYEFGTLCWIEADQLVLQRFKQRQFLKVAFSEILLAISVTLIAHIFDQCISFLFDERNMRCEVVGKKESNSLAQNSCEQHLYWKAHWFKLVKGVKYFGVQVNHQYKWTSQLAIITNKISRGIGMLRYAKQYLPIATVKTMYKSLVEPYFRCCSPVWGTCRGDCH